MLLKISDTNSSRKISLTPLIDVVFILLLFFMLSSSFSRWFSIDISTSKTSPTERMNTSHIRLLNNSGVISYEDTLLGTDYSRLINIIKLDPKDVFLIDSDRNVSTQTVVRLIDYLGQNGIDKVSLGTTFDIKSNTTIEAPL